MFFKKDTYVFQNGDIWQFYNFGFPVHLNFADSSLDSFSCFVDFGYYFSALYCFTFRHLCCSFHHLWVLCLVHLCHYCSFPCHCYFVFDYFYSTGCNFTTEYFWVLNWVIRWKVDHQVFSILRHHVQNDIYCLNYNIYVTQNGDIFLSCISGLSDFFIVELHC